MKVSDFSGMNRTQLKDARKLVQARMEEGAKQLELLDTLIANTKKPMTLKEVEKQLGYKVKIV